MRYTIVKHDSLEKLVAHVNTLIGEGWQIAGGCAAIAVPSASVAIGGTHLTDTDRHYAQAMVHPLLAPTSSTSSDCPSCAGTGQVLPAG